MCILILGDFHDPVGAQCIELERKKRIVNFAV